MRAKYSFIFYLSLFYLYFRYGIGYIFVIILYCILSYIICSHFSMGLFLFCGWGETVFDYPLPFIGDGWSISDRCIPHSVLPIPLSVSLIPLFEPPIPLSGWRGRFFVYLQQRASADMPIFLEGYHTYRRVNFVYNRIASNRKGAIL